MTEQLAADPKVDALRTSVTRLQRIAAGIVQDQLTDPAYPTEWSIADVLSHIGSGAVIMQRRLEDSLSDRTTPDDFATGIWDTWNAKTPTAQRDDALTADAAFLARIDAVTPDERNRFTFAMGPMNLGFDEFVGMRLSEHAFHTWDIEVAVQPDATIPPPIAGLIVDNLQMIARFTAKPTGDATTMTVTTTNPERHFKIDVTPEAATLTPATTSATADLELPAEAFARLVYGRLDPDHTPTVEHGPALDTLRQVFPGP